MHVSGRYRRPDSRQVHDLVPVVPLRSVEDDKEDHAYKELPIVLLSPIVEANYATTARLCALPPLRVLGESVPATLGTRSGFDNDPRLPESLVALVVGVEGLREASVRFILWGMGTM